MTEAARPLLALAERVVERAVAAGATAADVLVMEADAFSVQVRLGEVETTTGARDRGLGLRVFHGSRSASASTSDLSDDSVERFVNQTVELARLTQEDPFAGLPEQADPVPADDLQLSDGGTTLSMDERIALAVKAEQAALKSDARITNSEGAAFDSSGGEVAYARSNGFSGTYRTSSYGISVTPVATQSGHMQRDYWYTSGRHFADLEAPEAVGREAARRVLRRLDARKVATCRVPVVFDAETAASLLSHLASAVSGGSVYKQASFLGDKLGQPIANPQVTVIDDGRRPRGLGSRPFDGEGVPVARHTIVQDGVLQSFLLDCYSARKLGRTTTGNARRGLGGSPSPGPTNLYLEPGDVSPAEMVASVQRGFFVTELIGFGVNGVTGDYSRGAAGLWIENGEFAHPVEEVTISGNLLEMFRDIEMIGNDLTFRRRIAAPTVKVGEMIVAGD